MLSRRAILLFLGAFVVVYGCTVVLGVQLSLFAYTDRLLAEATGPVLGWIEGDSVERRLSLDPQGIRVVTSARWNPKDYVFQGSYYHHTHNLFVFLVLVLVSPGVGWRLKAIGLLGGLGLIFALDVVILIGDVWALDREAFGGIHPDMVQGPLPLVSFLVGQLHPTGGGFLLPMFVWVFVLLAATRSHTISHTTLG